ncbi:hypothetical protein [Conexibacter arvalis]|uniref:Heme exporter protein D n=1 Tax=Conexibacter arvalis TaxID=912552 RepID=A0A840IEZ2_9ACTN|nr:hypothetical protein [Conexibacter arvalis]MBB4662510.1 hypothetical protein [Conexibacter arvalis]
MTVYAHVGHWLVSMVYAAPALLLAGALIVSTIRQKRRDAERRAAAAEAGGSPAATAPAPGAPEPPPAAD